MARKNQTDATVTSFAKRKQWFKFFAVTEKDMALARALRTVVVVSLWQEKLLYIVIGTVVLTALLEPAGFKGSPLWYRLLVFQAVSLCILAYSISLGCVVCAKLARYGIHMYLSVAFNSLICSALLAPVLMQFVTLPEPIAFMKTFDIFFTVSLTSFVTSLVFLALLEDKIQSCFDTAGQCIKVLPSRKTRKEAFQEILPFRARGRLLSIEVQDKYIQVETTKGSALVLMSLTTAVNMLKADQGLRIHRSAWVSWETIDRLIYENGNPRLLDKRGRKWPVSRNQVNELKSMLERNLAQAAE